jgi:hypothetical protein
MPDINPLANLRDIHLPHAVSIWPLGPGYYGLIGLVIICILVYIKYRKKQAYAAPKKEALLKLMRIETDYTQKTNTASTAAAITVLLKQIALVYHPRIDVASLHGQKWLLFLQDTSHGIDFNAIQTSLLSTPFNPDATEDLMPLLTATREWIKQRSKRCLN